MRGSHDTSPCWSSQRWSLPLSKSGLTPAAREQAGGMSMLARPAPAFRRPPVSTCLVRVVASPWC
eukprot:6997511-Pyramimonas_sp.AAC.1